MNKTAIKNYAIWARVQLIEAAKQRAYEYEITNGGENKSGLEAIGGRLLSKTEKEQRNQLIAEINQKGFFQVMDEAAYTWFNRFIALRFMEVNGYLPSKIRVFTDESGAFKPEILKQAITVELDDLDRNKVLDLLDKQDNEGLYKYLIITQCNSLNAGLPYVFEKIGSWTELLFPANLLRSDSVIGRLISDIAVEDWDNEVEIIGWLYQYYISEKHEEVVDPLRGKTIRKEDIPAATQLFTTDWVVRYILDNSLGRYWIERHPESKLREKLKYYVSPRNVHIPTVKESILPEELKVLDPCVGSGHFLSYAFDILLEIYRECGWSDREAAKSILDNNLYGLDIDDRAAQLACFAVMMKARKYNRGIISANTKLHILAMHESASFSDELIEYVSRQDALIKANLTELRRIFNNAKEYGSIITVPKMDLRQLHTRVTEITSAHVDDLIEMAIQREATDLLMPLIQQAEIISGQYDVVVTNPPYFNKYSVELKSYITQYFADYKGDLFSVFMFHSFSLCRAGGYIGFMVPIAWMFNKSYSALREFIIRYHHIETLVQMAPAAFKEAGIDISAVVFSNRKKDNIPGVYARLELIKADMDSQGVGLLHAINDPNCSYLYETFDSRYEAISNSPIAYWISERILEAFTKGDKLGQIAKPRQGMATCDNDRFLRLWYEIDINKVLLNAASLKEAAVSNKKWVPYNKGGKSLKWFGNNEYLLNWEDDGRELKSYAKKLYGNITRTIQNMPFYFKECITWSLISTTDIAFRYRPVGSVFDKAGMSCFADDNLYQLLALCNSKITPILLKVLAPTINCQAGDVAEIPVLSGVLNHRRIEILAKDNIAVAKDNWDAFEVSWDFKRHPLV